MPDTNSNDQINGSNLTPPQYRRAEDGALLILLQQLSSDIKSLDSRFTESIAAIDTKLTEHMRSEVGDISAAVADIVNAAFPDGDPAGHKRNHEAQLARLEARAEFWKKMAFEITRYGLFGVLGWLGYHAWQAFLRGPG